MKLTLHTEGWYDASHSLENYKGKCANSHGHTYKVKVWVRGTEQQLKENGILWDFGNLKKVIEQYDHKNLNDSYNKIYNENSTAENQCLRIYNQVKTTASYLQFKVRVYEQLEPKESYCETGDWE